jgi:hypothetical protein
MAYGLKADTRYYYRACGMDFNYSGHPYVIGDVKSFRTDSDGDPVDDDLDIVAYSATDIDTDSVRLKGRVLGADNVTT